MAVLWEMLYKNTKKYELGALLYHRKTVWKVKTVYTGAVSPHICCSCFLSSVPSTFRKMTQNPAMMFQKNLLREQSTWRHGDAHALVGYPEELTFGIDFSAYSHLTWTHV